MGWPGAFQGAAGGAAAGGMAGFSMGGPPGAAIGAGIGAIGGGIAGAQGGKGGLSKFGAKRAMKAMKAAIKAEKKMAKFGLRQHKRASKEQMKINEDWIRKQQPIHREALEQQRKYQNRTAREQIPINAKLAGLEDRKAYERELQRNQYANELRIHNEPMREAAAAENRGLFEKYGLPHKYEEEKFYKKSLLTPEQKRNLAFQNQRGIGQKESLDISKNPLYQQATGVLSQHLDTSPGSQDRFNRPYVEDFQRNVLPSVLGQAQLAGGGQKGGHLARARIGAATEFGNKLAMMRNTIQQSALDKALQYANAPVAGRQQEIQNAQQNAQLGLGTKGFERLYKPSLYATPQGGTLAGGGQFNAAAAAPSFSGVGQAQYSPLNVPNVNIGGGKDYGQYFQQGSGGGGGLPGLNQFLSGAGQGAGSAAGNYFANRFSSGFNGVSASPGSTGLPSQQSWGGGQGGFGGGGPVS